MKLSWMSRGSFKCNHKCSCKREEDLTLREEISETTKGWIIDRCARMLAASRGWKVYTLP